MYYRDEEILSRGRRDENENVMKCIGFEVQVGLWEKKGIRERKYEKIYVNV